MLTNVAEIEPAGSILGHDLRIPVILAPIGSLQLFEEGGGATAAKAAEDFGIMNFTSSVCLPGLEGSAEASDSAKVYQLYLADDEDWMRGLIRRAQSAGYNGFCLTVDTQVYSRRERDILKRWRPPSVGEATTRAAPLNYQARMTWDLVKRIKDEFDIPLILKGIATAEDAGLACEHGVDVVYVSNHGGRQLDHVRGTLVTLPEVVKEVDGRTEVVVDGGFLRGTDVVKAKILGADAVGVGRLECIAMAAGGREGVVRMLRILEHEITDLPRPSRRHWLGRTRRVLPPPRVAGRSARRAKRASVPGSGRTRIRNRRTARSRGTASPRHGRDGIMSIVRRAATGGAMDHTYFAEISWDPEARVWYVSDTDFPGLVAEAASERDLIGRIRALVPELYELNRRASRCGL